MTYSISELGKAFGLSRSTLLYYDKLGLLTPSARSEGNYRLYSSDDYQRLQHIMMYRETGMSLQAIIELLAHSSGNYRTAMLQDQLEQLNHEIQRLRKQQQTTVGLLQSEGIDRPTRSMNKEQWVAVLASSGMTDEDMWLWHCEFEKRMPDAHQDFLESLNISEQEIQDIRRRSRDK